MKILRKLWIVPLALLLAVAFFIAPVQGAPNISASIAVVMDYHTGEILYEREMERRWIPASMTKSMTAFITYLEIEAGNLTPDTRIRVSAGAAAFSSDRRQQGSFVPLPAGEYISVEILLQLLMLPSANAAAVVLAEHISGSEAVFVARMNEVAAELGMYSSFTNSHGALPHHTNAYSIAILTREFISRFPDILRITAIPHMHFNGVRYNNTNFLLPGASVPFAGTDGFKTGTLRQAGWNHSVTAERDGRRVIAVVMNAPDNASRHGDARRLLQFGFDEIERREAERAERIRVFMDGRLFPLDTPPTVKHGEALLPIRAVFEQLGYTVEWQGVHMLAQLTHPNGDNITFFIGRNLAIVNGDVFVGETPAQIINGSIFVSMEFVAHATNTQVTWDMETGVILFNRSEQ
ncbi:MAG: stalk domain-containing protein [Defluviitaleaceae bacterium]|nr:stalk domain-containing protein [Defluviitaleaceae bacterium]MCL2273998.1 stalk domain-containing protein [Defluviitaleaceae bacterium]MCL2274101.1 stalk domain-containing protein [Defluviitaleaceae bacterium]